MFTRNLPSRPTPIIGREVELAKIATLLATPNCRLLTITGSGGIGKTRLAVEAIHQLGHHFANGIFFIPLTALGSEDFLILW
jgi:predicted ATPase